MTLLTLEQLTWKKLNDTGGTYFPSAQAALNEAQRLFVLLSLCLEGNATLNLTANQLTLSILSQQADFLLPLRLFNSQGQQMRPALIADLEALDSDWQHTTGVPFRYVVLGLDLLLLYPQPAAADTLTLVYARCPVGMASPGDVAEIRAASQYALVNYAAWALRQPQGGQELAKFASYLQEFLAEAMKVAKLVRDRNRDGGFITAPAFELTVTK